MSSPDEELSPLRATARRWPATVALVVIGAAAGIGIALQLPTTYTAEARMAVGGSDLSAQAVPGFALASSEIAGNYARFVAIGPVRQALRPAQRHQLETVTASPLPDSNVIRLEATATSEATAVKAASVAAKTLKSQVAAAVNGTTPDSVLAAYTKISDQVAKLQQQQSALQARVDSLRGNPIIGPSSPTLTKASDDLAALNAKLYPLQAQQNALGIKYQNLVNAPASQATLDIVQDAAPSFDNAVSRLERFGLAGLVLGFLVAMAVATLLERRRLQRRESSRAARAENATHSAPATRTSASTVGVSGSQ